LSILGKLGFGARKITLYLLPNSLSILFFHEDHQRIGNGGSEAKEDIQVNLGYSPPGITGDFQVSSNKSRLSFFLSKGGRKRQRRTAEAHYFSLSSPL
jgi:hypothetical protein